MNLDVQESAGVLRLLYGNTLIFEHSPTRPWAYIGKGNNRASGHHARYRFQTQALRKRALRKFQISSAKSDCVVIEWEGGIVSRFILEDRHVILKWEGAEGHNWFRLRFAAAIDDAVYGCGEQFSHLNLKGKKVPIWVSEPGVGRHWSDLIWWFAQFMYGAGGTALSTYFPHPSFVTSGGFYVHANFDGFSCFNFRRKWHDLLFWGIPESIIFTQCDSLPGAVSGLSTLLGKQPPLPAWAYKGVWLGLQGGTIPVQQKIQKAQDAGIDLTAVWCQDWSGKKETAFGRQVFWNWQKNPDWYPNLPGFIKSLHKQGIRFLGYINTFLDPEGNLHEGFSRQNFGLHDSSGTAIKESITFFPASLFDLTNLKERKWIKGIIKKEMIGIGMDGWMADYGEYLPEHAVPADGITGEKAHNRYPALWAQLNYEAVQEAGKLGELVVFHRSGFRNSGSRTIAVWNGDQLVQFARHDGLQSVIPAALSLGMIGIGNVHCDLGGFTTVGWKRRSKDLFFRWAELSTFMPTMRSHEGNRPDKNHQFDSDAETMAHLARMSHIHSIMLPYHCALANDYQHRGHPPMRPLIYHGDFHEEYRNNTAAIRQHAGCIDSYFYGRDLLIAPILKKRSFSRRVFLPKGTWVHLWSGTEYPTGNHRIKAPYGYPPVFWRKESSWRKLWGRCQHYPNPSSILNKPKVL